jgi:hypothetical protein
MVTASKSQVDGECQGGQAQAIQEPKANGHQTRPESNADEHA